MIAGLPRGLSVWDKFIQDGGRGGGGLIPDHPMPKEQGRARVTQGAQLAELAEGLHGGWIWCCLYDACMCDAGSMSSWPASTFQMGAQSSQYADLRSRPETLASPPPPPPPNDTTASCGGRNGLKSPFS